MDNEPRRKRISLSQKLEMVKNGQITESEQTGGDRGWGEERWGVSTKGYRGSSGADKNALELDCGGGCTTF